jgi:hypothetical protein
MTASQVIENFKQKYKIRSNSYNVIDFTIKDFHTYNRTYAYIVRFTRKGWVDDSRYVGTLKECLDYLKTNWTELR